MQWLCLYTWTTASWKYILSDLAPWEILRMLDEIQRSSTYFDIRRQGAASHNEATIESIRQPWVSQNSLLPEWLSSLQRALLVQIEAPRIVFSRWWGQEGFVAAGNWRRFAFLDIKVCVNPPVLPPGRFEGSWNMWEEEHHQDPLKWDFVKTFIRLRWCFTQEEQLPLKTKKQLTEIFFSFKLSLKLWGWTLQQRSQNYNSGLLAISYIFIFIF